MFECVCMSMCKETRYKKACGYLCEVSSEIQKYHSVSCMKPVDSQNLPFGSET